VTSAFVFGKEVIFQMDGKDYQSAPWPMCCDWMASMSRMTYLKPAGVGGIRSLCRETLRQNGWSTTHEMQ